MPAASPPSRADRRSSCRTRVPALQPPLWAPRPSDSSRQYRSPPRSETPQGCLRACASPSFASLSWMSGSAMGCVAIDSISRTGCSSRCSPLSPTNPGPCSQAGSLRGGQAASAHHWSVGHRGAAVRLYTASLASSRFSAHAGPGTGLNCSQETNCDALASVAGSRRNPRVAARRFSAATLRCCCCSS